MDFTFDYSDKLGVGEFTTDLRKYYPRPLRTAIRNQFYLIASFLILLTISLNQLGGAVTDNIEDGLFFDLLSYISFNIFFGGLFIVAVALIYEEFYNLCYYYGLDSGNLIVVRGVFVKRRSSYPLNKITDVYLDRNWLDLFFFLYNLNFSTPNNMSFNFGRIKGLNRHSAVALQALLTKIIAEGEQGEGIQETKADEIEKIEASFRASAKQPA